ncbi:MAG: hypothetical protein E6Q61_05415 [Nitrosomonas sp.]|nr:MAG: hypothetical protein E6Q61_05415 [Nitrosomonas sp.]
MSDDDELTKLWTGTVSSAEAIKPRPQLIGGTATKQPYQACDAKDKQIGFFLQWLKGTYSFYYTNVYTLLLNPSASELLIMTNNAVIQLTGRNLEPLHHALHSRTCHSLTEFNPVLFHEPKPSDPIIEIVQIKMATDLISGKE